jgi:hypothetical protein
MGKFNRTFTCTCKAVSLDGKLPSFISKEIYGYCKDLQHGLTLELDQIRPETQVMIANLLRDSLDDPYATLDLGRRARLTDPSTDMGFGVPVLGAGKVVALPVGWLRLGGNTVGDVAIWATNLTDPSKTTITGVTLRVTVFNW